MSVDIQEMETWVRERITEFNIPIHDIYYFHGGGSHISTGWYSLFNDKEQLNTPTFTDFILNKDRIICRYNKHSFHGLYLIWDGVGYAINHLNAIVTQIKVHSSFLQNPQLRIKYTSNTAPYKKYTDYDWKCEGCKCYNDYLVTGWCRGAIKGVERKSYGL